MYGQLFTLVHLDDPTPDDRHHSADSAIYAWGMQIDTGATRFAVVFRSTRPGQHMLGVHDSAESACARHGQLTPLAVRWAGSRAALITRDDTTTETR